VANDDLAAIFDAQGVSPSQAIKFFRQKTNLTSERFGEVMGEAHARAFTVAGATSEALLNDIRTAVGKALTEGRTLEQFRSDFDLIVKRRGWEHTGTPGWRAQIIYQTNLSTAYSAGEYAQMTTPEALDIHPYWRYVHHACPHPRVEHMAWDGLVLPADDPWWSTHYPPNGWRCHCTVEPVSRRQLARNGWEVGTAPPLDVRPWRNPATGKTEMVPKGIDPGFAYNPGQAWAEAERARAATRLEPRAHIDGVHPEHAPPEQRRAVQREDVSRILAPGAHGEVEAGALHTVPRQALGTDTDSVRLSSDTLGKQRTHHPELTDAEYAEIPQMLADPLASYHAKPNHVGIIGRAGRRLYKIVVKRTRDRKRLYFQSMHSTSMKNARSTLRGAEVIHSDLPDELTPMDDMKE